MITPKFWEFRGSDFWELENMTYNIILKLDSKS